jgi:hypothetical protein
MPSNPSQEELIARIQQAAANPAAVPVGEMMRGPTTPPDILSALGLPLVPLDIMWWSEFVEGDETLMDDEGNRKVEHKKWALVHLAQQNSMGRYWFSVEAIDQFMEFLTAAREQLSPIQPVTNKLWSPGK